VPAAKSAVGGYYAMAGYRAAGERAIRIDMLERLADMLRDKDSRGGFEANADMLSITGMTLEQFADLMTGLGYKAEKAEREKVKAVATEAVADQPAATDEAPAETPAEIIAPSDDVPVETTLQAPDTGPEMEVFYTFTWGGRVVRPARPQADNRPRGKGKPKGKAKPQADRNKPQSFSAKPKREKQIDPDNPFAAALAGFKKD
jgi:ATP-dependent RNA helicase SUPV3L1/SUV3